MFKDALLGILTHTPERASGAGSVLEPVERRRLGDAHGDGEVLSSLRTRQRRDRMPKDCR